METETKRSTQTNKALHKLFSDIALHCVTTGIDQQSVATKLSAYPCPVSPQFVKESWRAIQISITGKKSTTELSQKEVDQVYDVFNKFWSELTGEHFIFPSVQAMMAEEWYSNN